MNFQANEIGFSQRVRLEWLEETANLVLAGNGKAAINSALQILLKDKVSVGGTAERGNREKIITILMRIWLNASVEMEALRSDGLELLKRLPRPDRIAVHWGMVMAVYPFWAAVASQVGRLLKLQGTAAARHIQRRMREQFGERETVSRAARRVLRSYVDWRVLTETAHKGVYKQGLLQPIHDPKLVAWLIEASLYTRPDRSGELKDLLENTGLFPFRLNQISDKKLIAASARLEIMRHGVDDNLIMLQ